MGVVYFGTDLAFGREVAVKVLRKKFASSLDYIDRFEFEAQVNARLQHPGIVPVYQVGKLADGRPYYTMKRVMGDTFTEVLKSRPSPGTNLLGVLGQFSRVCKAMAYAHEENVLHRDLKPQNIMVREKFDEVFLMDWGIAKRLGDATPEPTNPDVSHEQTRGALGTIPYMAPEQASGRIDEVDKRSDVFGLGAILCTILAGQPPYIDIGTGKTLLERAKDGDIDDAYARLNACGADRELIDLTRKCLSPHKEGRPENADEVALEVARYIAGVEERRQQAELDQAKKQ